MRHFTVKICCKDEDLGDRELVSYQISDEQRKDKYFREMAFRQFEGWLENFDGVFGRSFAISKAMLEKEVASIEPVNLENLINPTQLAYAVYVGENQGNPNFLQLTDEGLKFILESNLKMMEMAFPFQNAQQRETAADLKKRARIILERMEK